MNSKELFAKICIRNYKTKESVAWLLKQLESDKDLELFYKTCVEFSAQENEANLKRIEELENLLTVKNKCCCNNEMDRMICTEECDCSKDSEIKSLREALSELHGLAMANGCDYDCDNDCEFPEMVRAVELISKP